MSSHSIVSSPPVEPSTDTPPPPPWVKQPAEETLQAVLKQNRLSEQALLQQRGVTDPLEMEFSAMVAPIMGACTKDSIAVRIVYKVLNQL